VVYILDQVRAFEEELLLRIKQQGLVVKPQILVVSYNKQRIVGNALEIVLCFTFLILFHR
jgi:hypothetical protein